MHYLLLILLSTFKSEEVSVYMFGLTRTHACTHTLSLFSHVDTIAMLPNPIAIDVLHHLCRATLTLNGIARDGSLERISQVINDDRRIPAHSPLRSKLLQVLSRAVPVGLLLLLETNSQFALMC
eukprot:m.110909 g.110909  ORF g.110909 m.110909 type:complete len:124 (+) comp12759_c0_seq9:1087-1458(+)